MKYALIALALITALATMLTAAPDAGAQTGTTDRYGCADLRAYQRALFTAISPEDVETLARILDKDFDRIRPSEFDEASRIMDEWAAELEAMPLSDVPLAARRYHATFIDFLGVSSAVMTAMGSGNMFAAIAYSDTIDEITLELEAANRDGTRKCGAKWTFDAVIGEAER